jgi:Tfp pilus assembly PilM family ATPase/Tfp pilus assembly protein PilN
LSFSVNPLKNFAWPKLNPFKRGFLPFGNKPSVLKAHEILSFSVEGQDIKCAVIKNTIAGGKEIGQLFRIEAEGGISDEVLMKTKAVLPPLSSVSADFLGVIPSYQAVTRNIEIPSLDQNEIREIISLQATRHTPYARNEIVIDFLNLGVFKSVYTKILLIIVPRTVIVQLYELAAKLDLKVGKIIFAPEAIVREAVRRFGLKSEKNPTCLVWINGVNSDFLISRGDMLLFVRNIPVGTQHFMVAKESYFLRFVEEVKKSFETYQSENIDQTPTSVALAGSLRYVDDLEQTITDILHIPVKRYDDLEQLNVHPEIRQKADAQDWSYLHVISSAYCLDEAVADLIPEEQKLKKTVEQRSKEIVKTGVLVMVLVSLICVFFISHFYFQVARIEQLSKRSEPIRNEARELEAAYSRIATIKAHFANRGKSLEILTQLYAFIPTQTYFTAVQYDDEKLTVKGTSYSKPVIFSMVDKMEGSDVLKNVQTKYINVRNENEREVADFEIVASFEK